MALFGVISHYDDIYDIWYDIFTYDDTYDQHIVLKVPDGEQMSGNRAGVH